MKPKTLHGISLTLAEKAWVVKVGKPTGDYFERMGKEQAMREYCEDMRMFEGRHCPHGEGIVICAETRSKAILAHIKEVHREYAGDARVDRLVYLDYTAVRYPESDRYLLADPEAHPRLLSRHPSKLHQWETEILHYLHHRAIKAWAAANPTAEVVIREYDGYWGPNRSGHGFSLDTAGRYLAPDAVSAFCHVCISHKNATICHADTGKAVFPDYLCKPVYFAPALAASAGLGGIDSRPAEPDLPFSA